MNSEELQKALERYNRERLAPARLERYLKEAIARKDGATKDETEVIRTLENCIEEAHQAIAKNEIDDLLQAFELIIRCAIVLRRPELKAVILSEQGTAANKSRIEKYKQLETLAIKLWEESDFYLMSTAARSPELRERINELADELVLPHPKERTIAEIWLPKSAKKSRKHSL